MSTSSLFNAFKGYFVTSTKLVVISVPATTGDTDVQVNFNGAVANYWFVKSGSTGGAGDTVQLSIVTRTGTAATLSSAISINTKAAGAVVPMTVLTLGNTALQQKGLLRVSAVAGTTSTAGTMFVLCTLTA